MIHTTTLKELRPELPKIVDRIDRKMDRYIITRHGKPVVVMLSVDDYESLIETLDILSDPKAMRDIAKGEKDIKAGRTKTWEEVKKSLAHL